MLLPVVGSVVIVVAGTWLVTSSDLAGFGWVLIVVGLLALVVNLLLARRIRQRAGHDRRPGPAGTPPAGPAG